MSQQKQKQKQQKKTPRRINKIKIQNKLNFWGHFHFPMHCLLKRWTLGLWKLIPTDKYRHNLQVTPFSLAQYYFSWDFYIMKNIKHNISKPLLLVSFVFLTEILLKLPTNNTHILILFLSKLIKSFQLYAFFFHNALLTQPRDGTQVSSIAGKFFTIWGTREALIAC